MDPKVVTFGEIMLRLSPPGHLRFVQATCFDAIFGGGESNVAVSLANYRVKTEFITRLPAGDLGEACLAFLRKHGVGTSHILRGGERIGIYFIEHGAGPRGSRVVYDRAHSSFAEIQPEMVDWETVLGGSSWFHWTGITPSISESAARTCLTGIQAASRLGLCISCDLNYRAKLWRWGKSASEVMGEMVSLATVATLNEEDADKLFGIRAPETDVNSGFVQPDNYRAVCDQLAERFPNLETIAVSLRGSLSASHNTWSGVLWHRGAFHRCNSYEITGIIDRVGTGDSFAAGLIFAMLEFGPDMQRCLDFAVAASALKHTVFGDFNLAQRSEVEDVMLGNRSGRVIR